MAKSGAQVAAKWKRNASAAVTDYKEGIQSVSESPTALAAKQLDKAKLNYNEAIDSGRMAKRLNEVTRESWIATTLKLGGDRYAGGIAAGEQNMISFMNDFLPFQASVSDAVRKMPSMNFEDNIARMTAQARGTHDYKNRR
jgi:hypothetical protein